MKQTGSVPPSICSHMQSKRFSDAAPVIEFGHKIGQKLFSRFSSIAYDKGGIILKPGKEALVAARVAKRQRALGISTPKEYLAYLEADPKGDEIIYFLDAISTNYTHFFREKSHFHKLSDEVRTWISNGSRRLRIWSAASSTGEEPYSISITVLETLEKADVDFKLLATDISTRVLSKAKSGVYVRDQLGPVEDRLQRKYFDRFGQKNQHDAYFEVKPDVRKHVLFKRLNLSKPPFPMTGPLDAVFCRNVMIYFDHAIRQGLVSEIDRLLKPGGILMIGHSETLTGIASSLQLEVPSVYRKPA